jgi:excisionase family DNA binding protein
LSQEGFWKVMQDFRKLVSPSYAAERLRVSRSYIKQLEREGKIRVYRVRAEDINWDKLPEWAWFIIPPKKKLFVFIPEEDVEEKRKEMFKKAEKRVRELSEKE